MATRITPKTILKVWQAKNRCLFELSWGDDQTLTAELDLPHQLTRCYQIWHQAYQTHYQAMTRAFVKTQGSGYDTVTAPKNQDWRTELVQAEAHLLSEFHHWLNHANLIEIRRVLQQSPHPPIATRESSEVFISCVSPFLNKLPWESWDIGGSESNRRHFIRMPPQKRSAPDIDHRQQNRGIRILAIFGDETGLDFQIEQTTLRSLPRWVFVETIQGSHSSNLKPTILSKISDPQGWDFLYFAGHSNETDLTGGALGLSPEESILLRELEGPLQFAIHRGLKGALFNSCNGLSLAEACLDMGLSQVIIFREPVHNTVSQLFFTHFITGLVQHQGIQAALAAATHILKKERIHYPSAYLVPSYFRHPQTEPFHISKPHHLQFQSPNWKQAIALSTLIALSLMPTIQGPLLQARLWTQAVYRQITGQKGRPKQAPTLLIQIDRDSLRKNRVPTISPILDRGYLAQLVTKLGELKPKVLGINYYFDRPQGEGDRQLFQALQDISPETQMVVPTTLEQPTDPNSWLLPLSDVVPSRSRVGDNDLLIGEIPFVRKKGDTPRGADLSSPPHPFGITVAESFRPQPARDDNIHPLTQLSYWFGQAWLHPIIDFSVAPQQVYQSVPAWKVLTPNWTSPQSVPIMMITTGGYSDSLDTFSAPAAIQFWRSQSGEVTNYSSPRRPITGGEIHAYLIAHHLTQGSVIPVPDIWIIVFVAAILSCLPLQVHQGKQQYWIGSVLLYGGMSLQLYISIGIILPFLSPISTLILYRSLRNYI